MVFYFVKDLGVFHDICQKPSVCENSLVNRIEFLLVIKVIQEFLIFSGKCVDVFSTPIIGKQRVLCVVLESTDNFGKLPLF